MPFRKKNRFKFTEKTQSKKGIVALCVAGVLLLLYIIMIYLAYRAKGQLSTYYGSVGILAILILLVNLVVSFQSTREENSFQLIPHIALIATILAGVCWIGTFVLGMR
ncbi:MAG: hypothetical protein E7282_03100 [Lachnospiraceae bacterium]|nr:hypothetical protein [Lachnospiraceae bacterium]